MSIAEIKSEGRNLSEDDARHLAAYFHHLARRKSPAYAASLDQAWDDMEAGDKTSLQELERIDRELRGARL